MSQNLQVEEITKTQVKLTVGFWHTAVGITIKRVAWQVVAAVLLIVFDALTSPSINWNEVVIAARVQVAYIILATLQTVNDPQIPNVPSETVTAQK